MAQTFRRITEQKNTKKNVHFHSDKFHLQVFPETFILSVCHKNCFQNSWPTKSFWHHVQEYTFKK